MGSVGLTTILFVTPGVCLIGCFIYYYTGGEDGPMTTVLSYFNKFLPWKEWTDFLPLSDCLHLILSVFGIKSINFYVFYGNHYMMQTYQVYHFTFHSTEKCINQQWHKSYFTVLSTNNVIQHNS